jgi:hypothetical protein
MELAADVACVAPCYVQKLPDGRRCRWGPADEGVRSIDVHAPRPMMVTSPVIVKIGGSTTSPDGRTCRTAQAGSGVWTSNSVAIEQPPARSPDASI